MGDNTGSLILVGFLGVFVAAIGLGFYQTYAMLSVARTNPEAATRLATGVGVGMAATGIGHGIGASNNGGRRRTGRKRNGKKTYRKSK
jgi:hypothetical protein